MAALYIVLLGMSSQGLRPPSRGQAALRTMVVQTTLYYKVTQVQLHGAEAMTGWLRGITECRAVGPRLGRRMGADRRRAREVRCLPAGADRHGWSRSMRSSEAADQSLISVMRANPEPENRISLQRANRAIPQADADGVDRLRRVHLLEAKSRVVRIVTKEAVSETGLPPHVLGQTRVDLPEARSRD